MAEESVFNLLNRLCTNIYEKDLQFPRKWQPHELELKKRQHILRKLRRKCFEILLHKTSINGASQDLEDEIMFDVAYRVPELSWEGRNKEAERVSELVKVIFNRELYKDDSFVSILDLLVRLKDSEPYKEDLEPKTFQYEIVKPYDPNLGPRPYTILPIDVFDPPAWMEQLDVPRMRGYLPEGGSFPFDSEPGHDLPFLGRFITPATIDGAGSCVPVFRTPLLPELRGQRGLQVPKLALTHHELDEGFEEGSRVVSPCSGAQQQKGQQSYHVDLRIWEEALHFEMPRLRTWECLGRRIVAKERPFLSEAGKEAGDHLWEILRLPAGRPGAGGAEWSAAEEPAPRPRPLENEVLIRDLVHLLMGVPSHSFLYDEEKRVFTVAPGLCMMGLSPETLSSVCQAFLDAGTCCRRLQDFCSSCPRLLDKLHGKGLVMQALQDHVRVFLQFHRGASLLLPNDRPLLSVLNWAERLIAKILAMAQLCCVAPSLDMSLRLPAGMALVSYLYERLSNEARPDISCIIYSTLQACVRVYFRFLQRWIFEGVIHDTCGEFFVQLAVTPPGMAHTRKEWSQRYQLVQGAVPGFLRGLEEDILLCGKTVQLLKLCCPKAALCIALQSGYPAMPCCLHGRDIQQLAAACTEFEGRVRKLAGTPPISSAADLWPKRQLSVERHALQAAAQQARQQNLLKSKLEREAGRQAVAAQQQQWRRELQEQAQAAETQRREMREQELHQERELQAYWQRQQEEEDQRKEEEKQRIVEYYEELSEIADKRKRHAEWRMERMRLSEQREEFLLSDRREWKALAELNQKNMERAGVRPAGVLEVIEEDAAVSKALPQFTLDLDATAPLSVARTDTEDIGSFAQNEQVTTTNNNQSTPNNNDNHNINDNNNFHRELPHLLDTTKEDIALGNLIPLQAEAMDDVAQAAGTTTTVEAEKSAEPGTQQRHALSAVDRNRQKVLEEEFGIEQGKAQRPQTVPLYKNHKEKDGSTFEEWSDNTNQRQRNRWNMLHGDVNVVTGVARGAATEGVGAGDGDAMPAAPAGVRGDAPQDANASGDQVEIVESPDERMSVTKSDSSNSVNVYKSASAFSSKTNSSYNIASMTTSSSFDLGSGKYTLSTPTSTDGSVDAFKSCVSGTSTSSNIINNINNNNINGSSGSIGASENSGSASNNVRKGTQTTGPVPFWKSMRLSCLSEESKLVQDTADKGEQPGDDLDKLEQLSDDFTLVNVALQKSVAIPLHTQLRLANEAVLKYFFEELDLQGHCHSLRSYFLMTDGEYSHTMTCDLFQKMATVQQPSDLLNIVCLNELLRKALSASLGGKEENAERLSFKVLFTPERFTMTSVDVLRCLNLRYHVGWPLNIIFTESALTKYNDIFGFLLKVRLVSWAVEDAFHKMKEMGDGMFERPGRRRLVQLWRHEMTHFVQAVQGYIMSTALQTSWEEFEKNLAQAHTLDKIYTIHVNYVKRILQRCLLSKQFQQMLSILLEIFNVMLRFHEQLLAKPVPDSQVFHKLGRLHHKYRKVTSLFYSLLSKLVTTNCMPYLQELFEVLTVNNHYASLSISSSIPMSTSSSTSGANSQRQL